MDDASPPEEAYSRVTNPERFRPLHAFADAVVAALLESYEIASVERSGNTTRIVPSGNGSPVTIEKTDFPGLMAQFGERAPVPFPSCGCDACSEDPFGVFEEFHRDLWALVNGVLGSDWSPWIRQRQW